MKVVYCISGMYKSGGIERVLAGKVNYLVAHGIEATIITTDQNNRPDFFPIDPRVNRIDLGLNYDQFDELPTWKRYWETHKLRPHHRRLLEKALLSEHADITVSVLRHESTFLPDLQDGSKKILESHSSKFTPVLMYPKDATLRRFFGKWRMKGQERLASRSDRFVILTEEEWPLWQGKAQVAVIPNALPFTTHTPAKCINKRLIAVGRMEYQKNFSELLQIWAKVASSYPDWSLHIYGSGWMLDGLKRQAQYLGISSQVVFEGAVSNMEEAYRESSVYVMTSHFEGLPMVLLEAQASGLPIVSYACPSGPKDIVTDGVDGYLVPLYDHKAFQERLQTLMSNEDLRVQMGKAAVLASQRYEETSIMERWVNLFTTLSQE